MRRKRSKEKDELRPEEIESAKLRIEALLFSTSKPIAIKQLMDIANIKSRSVVESILETLKREYEEKGHAFTLSKFPGDKYMMHLKPELASQVRRFTGRFILGTGILRTLSFIAYHQPIQRSTVAAVRGGRAYSHINALIEHGLVEAERKGKSVVLRTTKLFADFIGVDATPSAVRKKIQEVLGMEAFKRQEEVKGQTS